MIIIVLIEICTFEVFKWDVRAFAQKKGVKKELYPGDFIGCYVWFVVKNMYLVPAHLKYIDMAGKRLLQRDFECPRLFWSEINREFYGEG